MINIAYIRIVQAGDAAFLKGNMASSRIDRLARSLIRITLDNAKQIAAAESQSIRFTILRFFSRLTALSLIPVILESCF
jgi:hypothetical protein